MSTFDGTVPEFPLIQIDYFRKNSDRPPPLACFLSHVHSDHLQGLESFRAPFIYCSAATRELLLRIEKYPHRMNFNKNILESRRLHYKHLYKLLRPIPLNTPTEIELTPRLSIRVTLFDANHCTGAVMFLIEGDGKAILYTGDIRSESWWVNSLVRNPILVPYTLGGKKLDKIYLDTTFSRADNLRHSFPSKASGLAELLGKVKNYPDDTIFYFRAWTFGYEEVWMALSAALNAKIHVNRYQLGLYRSVSMQARSGNGASEASALCGYELGNEFVPGCLSEDETCRLHSCESDLPCPGVRSGETVYIEPIVSRLQDGSQLPEVGIGGGAGDLYQTHELELPDQTALEELEKLCHERIHDNRVLSETRDVLFEAYNSKKKTLSLDSYGIKYEQDIPLEKLVTILSHGHSSKPSSADIPNKTSHALPTKIQFPYSRHSSYSELCELVAAFTPKDVFPCTTDPLTWTEDTSIRSLFGHLCSGNQFSHDIQMRDTISNDKELLRSRSRKRARSEEGFSPRSSQVSGSSFMVDSGPRVCDSFESSTSEPARNVAAKPVTADVNFSSSSSAARNLLPSSLESIPEHPRPVTTATATATTTTTRISDPLTPIDHTTEMDRVKRNKIRHARQFLQSNLPHGMVSHLGPLPSSWPTEERDGFNPRLTNNENGNRSGNGAIDGDEDGDEGEDNSLPLTTSHSPSPSPPNSPSHNLDNHPSESQLTNTLSVSDSAFAPSFSSQDQDQDQAQAQAQPYGGDGCDDRHQETVSSRNRKAAYLAARADSFDAWGLVALGSAGNNHTEEEIEL